MVIDDSPTMRQSMTLFLADQPYTLICVADALSALPPLFANPPQLILCDVTMPGIDGFQWTRLLRQHAAFAQLPIILLSARDGRVDRARARLAGATDFLPKPFSADQLKALLARHLP